MCNLYFYMSMSCWFPESLSVFLGILLKFQTTLQEFSLCLQSRGGLKLCICQIILVSYCERWNYPNGKHYQVFCMYSSSLVRFFKKIWSIYASYLHETKRQKDFEFLSPFLTSFAVMYTWHVNIVGTVCFCSVVFVADMIQKEEKKENQSVLPPDFLPRWISVCYSFCAPWYSSCLILCRDSMMWVYISCCNPFSLSLLVQRIGYEQQNHYTMSRYFLRLRDLSSAAVKITVFTRLNVFWHG